MFTILHVVSQLLLFIFAVIGVVLLVILWDIRQHPLSIFRWIELLRRLPD